MSLTFTRSLPPRNGIREEWVEGHVGGMLAALKTRDWLWDYGLTFFSKVPLSHVKFMNFSWTGMSKNTREPQENPVEIVGVDCSDVPPPPAESAVSRHRVLVDFLDLQLVGCEISIIPMKQYELCIYVYIYMNRFLNLWRKTHFFWETVPSAFKWHKLRSLEFGMTKVDHHGGTSGGGHRSCQGSYWGHASLEESRCLLDVPSGILMDVMWCDVMIWKM